MQNKFSLRMKYLLALPLLLFLLAISTVSEGQTVTLDQADLDYAPGETVYITGTEFMPGEVVTMTISHIEPGLPLIYHEHALFYATANADGSFTSSWYVEDVELNTTLLLMAEGDQGSLASIVFTDAIHLTSININSITSTSVCAGSTIIVNISATGTGNNSYHRYYVQMSNSTGSFQNVPNIGTSSVVYEIPNGLDITATIPTDISAGTGYLIRVITSLSGNASKSSAILVNSVSTAPTSINGTTTICSGSATTLTAAGGTLGTSGIYEWGTGTSVGSNIIEGANSVTYTTPSLTTNNTYWVRRKDPGSCNTVTNGVIATVTVNSLPEIGTQPRDQTIFYGTNSNFTVTATGTGTISYQWQENTGNGFSNVTNGGIYSGATSNTLVLNRPPVSMSNYQYRCVVTGQCSQPATSNAATLTVTPKPITITPDAGLFKVYGEVDPTFTYTGSEALQSGDSFSGALGRIAGNNVGTYAYTLNSLSAGPNYTLSINGTNTFAITARSITINADVKSKTYGDTDPAFTYQITNGTLAFRDAFTGSLARDAGENVGAYAITQGTVALTDNYTLTYVGADLTIGKRLVEITADAKSKEYGNDDPAFIYQISTGSLAFSDVFTGSLTRDAGENVGDYAITQGTVALNANYTLSYVPANLTISKREVAIKADVKSKVYGENDPALTYQITFGSLAFSDAFTGLLAREAGENVGAYAITQGTVALNANYTLSYVPASLTISKREVAITADVKSKVYGENDPALTYAISSGTLAFSDAFTGLLAREAGENVGDYAITQGSVALSSNYTLSYVGADLTIGKRSIQITADAKSKTYGDTDPTFTYQITNGTLAFSDTFTGSLTRDAGENVGAYAITQGTVALTDNYTLTYVGADLTIGKRLVEITADAKNKVYGNDDPALTYQITFGGMAFSDEFTGSLTRDAGENVGDYAITQGTVALTDNYTLTYVGADLTIGKRLVQITAAPKSKTYGDTDPALTYAISAGSLAFSDAFKGLLAREAGENVGDYAITQGTVALSSNYTLSYVPANLTISKREVTITADAKSKTYGDLDPELTYAISSGTLAFNDAFTGALTRDAGEAVGLYTITQGSIVLSDNYGLSYVPANLTIRARSVTITADAKSKVYGYDDPALTYQITAGSLAFSDALTGALTRDAGENVGSYNITQGSVVLNSNYTLTYVGADLTIGKRLVEITADAKSKVYGENDPLFTYQITSGSLAFSDAFTGLLSREAGENVGDYAITQGSVALNANYTLSYVGADLTIGKRLVDITAAPKSKTYGDLDPALTYAISAGSLAFSDEFTGSLTRDAGENVGAYAITQGTVALSNNYTLSYVSANLTITRLSVVVNAQPANKYFGQDDPHVFLYSSEPAIGTSLLNNHQIEFGGTLTREPGECPEAYDIIMESLANSNYNITYNSAPFTIKNVSLDASQSSVTNQVGSPSMDLKALVLNDELQPVNDVKVSFKVFDGAGVSRFSELSDKSDNTGLATNTINISELPIGLYKIVAFINYKCETTVESVAYMTIYDPNSSFITGGGWIKSPAGALTIRDGSESLEGKANFGFNAKYKRGKTITAEVEGNTEFQFQTGNFNFKSNLLTTGSLVISGAKATFRGEGTVNGIGNYGFMISAFDRQISGDEGYDLFRIKIWDKNKGNTVVYDNNREEDENALPTTALGGGSIVIHSNVNTKKVGNINPEAPIANFESTLKAYPNPFTERLNIEFSYDTDTKARLEIYSVTGAKLQTLYDGPVAGGQLYNFEYLPRLNSSQVVFYHLTLDGKTHVGKMLYNQR